MSSDRLSVISYQLSVVRGVWCVNCLAPPASSALLPLTCTQADPKAELHKIKVCLQI
ncbi:hypothetical protein [Scytonema millei]|uniref:Uncharacterized protein n=1 Tax=Scytonema millei VB511283 TaxID=1245923 RepID=A0A9X5E604_9CYAN|nr:hypothetical protein [Scytonema millei]NHC35448.1 hypothetical protein [Scytonema millei VB511283]